MVNSFSDVIDTLGGVAKFSRAVGMKQNSARQARKRNSLAVVWFPKVAEVAEAEGHHEITVERLVTLAAERQAA
jgi:hypothetical protein